MTSLLPEGTIAGFGLVLARTGALVGTAPLLGSVTGFSSYKIALVFALSLLLYSTVGEPLRADVGGIEMAAMALREVLIGVFFAFLLTLALTSVNVMGHLIGQEMGFMVARQVDPITGVSRPLISAMYETLFILGLLSFNAHHLLIRSLASSFERAPIGDLHLGSGLFDSVQAMFGEMFGAGIIFAAPIMIFLALVSVLIGLLARVVPHLNVMEIGFTIRILVAMSGMFLFAPMLEPIMTGLFADLVGWLERGLDSLEV